ncbi:unnamed protein product, partial [Prunus brigantina]
MATNNSQTSNDVPPPSIPSVVNIKLDRSNYPLWLAQIVPLLKSRDLLSFVDGTSECPPKTVAGSTTVNLAYTTWVQQDQLILSWINSSLTPSVLSTVSRYQTTSRTTWQALEHIYASASQNNILHLRNELLRTMKGDLSVSDYLDCMNAIHDNLALSGKPVDDDELVQIITNNLGPAYEMIVSVVKACDTPISCHTLEALLLIAERRMTEQTIPMLEN